MIAAAPESVEALCLLGQSHLALRERVAGCRAAEAALRIAPDSEWAHRLHSLALTQLGRHGEAVAAAREAVRLAPWLAETHRHLAGALIEVPGPFAADEARAAAEHALQLAPHAAASHVTVGVAAGRQGRRRDERDAYRRALELDPTNATALNNLAAVDVGRGRLAGASRFLTGALRQDPHQPQALANLDVVVTQVVRRLTVVLAFGGLGLALMVAGSPGGDPAAWWACALAGVGVLAVAALVGWHTLRHLPPGARRHVRGWPRRVRGADRLVAAVFCAALVAVLATALLPGEAAGAGAAAVGVMFRVVWVMGVVAIVRALIRRGDR